MSTGDKLFVPSGGAVSWRAKGGVREDDEAIAVRFCYVDASNFNSVKRELPLYAAVEVRLTLRLETFQFNTLTTNKSNAMMSRGFPCFWGFVCEGGSGHLGDVFDETTASLC